MLPGHKKAFYDIAKCQTEAAGGGLEKCNKCGYEHFVYYSCHNRSCPRCHRIDIEEWKLTITIPEAEPEPEPGQGSGDSTDKKKRICPKCKMGNMELVEQCEQFDPIMGRAPPC